jgi:hypothetical protein
MGLLKENFKNYIKKVDELYVESTKSYSSLFGEESSDLFCRAFSHIIRQFIESQEDSNYLFIKIPIDELGTKEGKQEANILKLEEAISHTLAMAVYPDNIQVDDFSSCEVGDFYYTATNISCKNGKVRPRLWEIKQSQRIDKYPKEIFPDERRGASLLIAEAQERCNIFQSHINNTYKLCSLPENNNEPTQKKMRKMAEWLDVYKNNKTSKHYENALIIGYGRPQSLISNFEYIAYPIKFQNKFNNVERDKQYDIIVLVGDKSYKNALSRIGNRVRNNLTKKVIYVGSELPQDFYGKVFEFSYRECYHYFANDKFPAITKRRILWEELDSIIASISNIFSEDIDSKLKWRAISYAITPYLGYNYFNDSRTIRDRLLDFINDEFNISNDQWDTIVQKIDNINLPEKPANAPKKTEYEKIKKRYHNSVLIKSGESYVNRIKTLLSINNDVKNTYVVDICSEYKSLDVVKCLLDKLALGNFYLLSYNNVSFERLKDLQRNEYKIYNKEYRKQVLGCITYNENDVLQLQGDQPFYGSLGSFDDSTIDDEIIKYYESNQVHEYYTLISEDGDRYDVSGDIIINKQHVNANYLFENKEDILPYEVSFYITPCNFQDLRDVIYDLPAGENIDTYANLWKKRLQKRCVNNYAGNGKKMWEDDNFKKIEYKKFKKMIEAKYESMFPSEFVFLSKKMKELGLLNDNEYTNLRKAKVASDKARIIGRNLKKGLYEYILTGKSNVNDVNIISKNSEKRGSMISLDDLKELCIKTINVKDIIKSNRRDNDGE